MTAAHVFFDLIRNDMNYVFEVTKMSIVTTPAKERYWEPNNHSKDNKSK